MVGRWGMSDQIGPVSALPGAGEESYALGNSPGAASQHTLELIDEDVNRIITECSAEAKRILADHREQLDDLAQTLLERETLDQADAYAAARIPQPGAGDLILARCQGLAMEGISASEPARPPKRLGSDGGLAAAPARAESEPRLAAPPECGDRRSPCQLQPGSGKG
jgi:Peptidase family M41